VNALFSSFTEQLMRLPDNTRIYPGHDYLETNLKFTLAREPKNTAAQSRLTQAVGHDPALAMVTTLAQEKEHNTFMRLGSPELIEQLRMDFPKLDLEPDAKTVFQHLRTLRNSW
jgi:hydroxyacylglutathione hydrolase